MGEPLGPLPAPGREAATEVVKGPVADLGDAVAGHIQEVPVVAHQDHRALRAREEPGQPAPSHHVEVVRGLVQQEQIGLSQEHPGQRHPNLPAAAQRAHGLLPALPGEAEAMEDLPHPLVHCKPTRHAELLGLLCEPVHGAAGSGLHSLLRLGHRRLEGEQTGHARACFFPAAPVSVHPEVLVQVAEGESWRCLDASVVDEVLSSKHPQQGGLARAVPPHETDCLARMNGPACPPEEVAAGDGDRGVTKVEHGPV